MKFLTTSWIAKALGQSIKEDKPLSLISSDTREIKANSLFVALSGENADGHNFVDKAQAAGAIALVHRKDFAPPKGMISFPVENTLEAWRLIARAWRKEFQIPVVVVAGSAGKTTSKEFLSAILRGKYKNVLQTIGSQNGFQGVPATLLRLRAEHEAAVIEVGIDDRGAMIQHLDVVAPSAGLLSSIGPEHLEKLIDLDTVEFEEGLLFKVLEERKGIAAVNLDDTRIAHQARQLKNARVINYGLGKGEAQGKILSSGEEISLEVSGIFSGREVFSLPLEGSHNARNLLGAIALAYGLGLSAAEMKKGLATFTPPPGRSEVHEWKGCRVLADTYNANPASVEAALDTLFLGSSQGEAWVCLGDMLELGTFEEKMHRGLADPILKHGVKHVFLYGPRMKNLLDELRGKKFAGTLKHFDTHEAMASALAGSAKPGDRILIKGSRGMRMENMWKALQNAPKA